MKENHLESNGDIGFLRQMTYIVATNGNMKKKLSSKKAKSYSTSEKTSKLSEPYVAMPSIKKLPNAFENLPYSHFKKITAKIPFTQTEWAAILHLSERTLQRYAKDNKSFEGIYADRIIHIEKLLNKGLKPLPMLQHFTNG